MNNEIFDGLFVFEMANNHMGDVEHGLRIINEIHNVSKNFPFRFAFKFQYRDLDTFIHPKYKNRQDIKYVKRFTETRLNEGDFLRLKQELDKLGFITICTPFDEASVDLIERHQISIIKVGSCSFTDWPLLERIVKTNKPIILSTAGATLEEIDNVVSFFEHRDKIFCLMHCVGEYPTKNENLQLNQIDLFKCRYPSLPVGFSTHEEPDNLDSIKIAIAKGAVVFERHVGVSTDRYKLNAYSSTPQQIEKWLNAAKDTYAMCGIKNKRKEFSEKEKEDLRGLKRGVFAKENIARDSSVALDNTFLAIPIKEGQLAANDLSKYMKFITKRDILESEPVCYEDVSPENERGKILQIVKEISKLIKDSRVVLQNKLDLEISHHYGIDKFNKWGCSIVNCINREYCKKIIILLPGQTNPSHFHNLKEETFHVLYGDLAIKMTDSVKEYKAGDLIVIERGIKHSFSSIQGAVFEEISTTHYKDDSHYEDETILKNKNRKTYLTFWADWLTKTIS